jgi:voltage-gated potassium channel
MSDRQRTFIRIDAHVSRLAALALVTSAMERYGTGVWQDVGRIGFAVIWAVVAAVVLVELFFAIRLRRGVVRALLWLALVALSTPWAPPLFEAMLAARTARAIKLRQEFADQLGRQLFSGRGLRFVTAVSALGLLALGWLFSAVETDQHLTVGDGVWFALVTSATVGYGDIVPSNTAGRIIAAALMVLGLFVVGLLTGAVAERFTRNKQADEDVVNRLDELAARLERIESGLGRSDGAR